ncbi:MAG: alpha/beta hydrolase [Janthinobacterium lividum]
MRMSGRAALAASVLALGVGATPAPPPLADGTRLPLWPHGVPGFEARAAIPERSQDYWTDHINDPGVVAFLPRPANATGTAVLIVPGGGHRQVVTTTEGDDVGRWFARRGVAAFVLRYRLFREAGSPYRLDDARADVERAMRLVRSRAPGLGIDPHRIGIWGFSAGGELARMATLSAPVPAPTYAGRRGDAIDRVSARPDFAILEFPGPAHAEEHVTRDAVPVLLSAANDDPCCSAPTMEVANEYRAAGASLELHLYAAGGHAYNLGEDTPLASLQHWPDRLLDWMGDRGLLGRPAPVFVPK